MRNTSQEYCDRFQISSTAKLIARATILNANVPDLDGLVTPEAKSLSQAFLMEFSTIDSNFSKLVTWGAIRKMILLAEKLVKPGLTAHYALRKKHIENLVVRSLKDKDLVQVVIVGCGFDTLAIRLHREYPDVRFFELDGEKLISRKERALRQCGVPADNLHFLKLSDNTDAIKRSLAECPDFSTVKKTLFLIEGVLMYLEPAQVTALFKLFGDFSRENKVIFTFLEPGGAYEKQDRPLAEKLADLWLKQKGESYKWSVGKEVLCQFFRSLEMEIVSVSSPQELRASYLSNPVEKRMVLPRDEHIAEARFSSPS